MFNSLVQDLKGLLYSDSILNESKKLDELIQQYNLLKNQNNENEDVNQLLANDLINELKNKIIKEKEKQKKQNAVFKEQKENLIEQLDNLIQNEKNIGKAFADLKTIRESWTNLSEKSPLTQKDIDKKFTKKLEDFYYNINIYKAIQEHDLKRNQQLKEVILEKLEKAVSGETSKNLILEIKRLRAEWESIGPVTKELQDDFWAKYRTLLDSLYSNFKEYKESEKEEQMVNFNKKTALIQYIKEIDVSRLNSVKDWKLKVKKVLKKQEEWKSIGFVPKDSKDKLWESYRLACDAFFGAKKTFFEEQKKVYKANKILKNELCKKAEELLQSENANELTKEFIDLQSKWKKIGPVHQRDEQYLWHKFQKSCNIFFQKKKESRIQLNSQKDSLNIEKETIINKLKETSVDSEKQLLEHLSLWWKTNRDHTRKSNILQNKFHEVLESKLNNKTAQEFVNENIQAKIEIYKEFNDDGIMLSKERKVIQDKIAALQKDVAQYENNLSFFGNSKRTDALMKDVYLQMDNLNCQIAKLKDQLKLIKMSLK
ncbi:MAG: hypothetical protein CMP63_00355 [Flavobacteriales bacterium]|nr:hypothetical protein [Flavobacteriales bacterium]|tara:strand:- start:1613 stop:3238 length:1626 start_codon:yes stop_codon:yes gene_type:complete